jgi:hypothetical protein
MKPGGVCTIRHGTASVRWLVMWIAMLVVAEAAWRLQGQATVDDPLPESPHAQTIPVCVRDCADGAEFECIRTCE